MDKVKSKQLQASIAMRATKLYENSVTHRNSAKYVQIWTWLAHCSERPIPVFAYCRERGIGSQISMFWEAWSLSYEGQGDYENADKMYMDGLRVRRFDFASSLCMCLFSCQQSKAQPADELLNKYDQFKKRWVENVRREQQQQQQQQLQQEQQQAQQQAAAAVVGQKRKAEAQPQAAPVQDKKR